MALQQKEAKPQIVIAAQAVLPLKMNDGGTRQVIIRWLALENPNAKKFTPGMVNKWYVSWSSKHEKRDCPAVQHCAAIARGHQGGQITCEACPFFEEDMDTAWLGVYNDLIRSSKRPKDQMLKADEGLVNFILYAPGDRQIVARMGATTFPASPAPPPPPRRKEVAPDPPVVRSLSQDYDETVIKGDRSPTTQAPSRLVRNYTKTFVTRYKLVDGQEKPRYFEHADFEQAVSEYFRLEMSGHLPKLLRCGQREEKPIDRPTLLRRFIVIGRRESRKEHDRLHWFDALVTVTSGSNRRLIGKIATKAARRKAEALAEELGAKVELFEIKSSSLRDKPKGEYDHRPPADEKRPICAEVLSGSEPAETPPGSSLSVKNDPPHPALAVAPIGSGKVSVFEGQANLTISNDGPGSSTAFKGVPVEFVVEMLTIFKKHGVPIKFQGEFSHQEV